MEQIAFKFWPQKISHDDFLLFNLKFLKKTKFYKAKMYKIELNKRTLRTLSMSELTMVGGASEDGDEDPVEPPVKDPKKTQASECVCASEQCPSPSMAGCIVTDSRKCCPNTGD
ncbi:hypothetical protein [Janthinobacterium sp. PAMC25594]|uniref:hypothetical protein n=1 Tax=Janthinobacterium sp. PAMC25594 TaxID=2861284 RepID=UPI001C637277|nr:hypothetical protein [Janthinobacterium sp. PAMC25594]QYG06801.1 hypothetical protein KY494_26845 [Janthinobacterium sp. PAMC25594]